MGRSLWDHIGLDHIRPPRDLYHLEHLLPAPAAGIEVEMEVEYKVESECRMREFEVSLLDPAFG